MLDIIWPGITQAFSEDFWEVISLLCILVSWMYCIGLLFYLRKIANGLGRIGDQLERKCQAEE